MPPESRAHEPDAPMLRRTTGLLLLAVPAMFVACFAALQVRFDYPAVLRSPPATVLAAFAADERALVPLWYGMLASALLFVPLGVGVAALHRGARAASFALLVLGALAGLVQAVGLSRWVFAVPALARRFASTEDPQERMLLGVVFDTLGRVLGVGIGEHMGYCFTVGWTLVLAWAVRRARPATAAVGGAAAAAIGVGLLEPLGLEAAGAANAAGYTLWCLWLAWLGAMLCWGRPLFADPRI